MNHLSKKATKVPVNTRVQSNGQSDNDKIKHKNSGKLKLNKINMNTVQSW